MRERLLITKARRGWSVQILTWHRGQQNPVVTNTRSCTLGSALWSNVTDSTEIIRVKGARITKQRAFEIIKKSMRGTIAEHEIPAYRKMLGGK